MDARKGDTLTPHNRGGFILPLSGEPPAPHPPIPFPPGQAPPHHLGGSILPLTGEPSSPHPPIPFPPGQAPPPHHLGGSILPLTGEPSSPHPPIPFPWGQAPPPHHLGGFILPLTREPSAPHPLIPFPPGQAPFPYNPVVGRMVPLIPTLSQCQPRLDPSNCFPPNPYLNPAESSSHPVGFVHSNVVFMGQDPRIGSVCNYRAAAPPEEFLGRPERMAGNRNYGNDQKRTWDHYKMDSTFGDPVRKHSRREQCNKKGYRCDSRGQDVLDDQTMRKLKMETLCRSDINRFDAPFIQVFELLIPVNERKIKQKQLLSKLEKIVMKEWPQARLHTYGSCDNTFGFSNSDVDISLAMENYNDINKGQIVLELANVLKLENYQNVKPIPHARIPVLKFIDPISGIPCDICINNALAVVNTKLLRDYAQIDVRLRQLVFIVKHWAKSRQINETYQGTLSSYAYVLMCINFLQQRKPAIVPCLQEMETTYSKTVGNIQCSYFDQVEELRDFGVENEESIAQLVWGFFHYWAYCHDYENDVISVRTGGTLSKSSKGWNTRIGNNGHFISIEDPFDKSHDLSRGVDKNSIRVLREEFERAAEIMQHDSNPSVTLFEAYVPS